MSLKSKAQVYLHSIANEYIVNSTETSSIKCCLNYLILSNSYNSPHSGPLMRWKIVLIDPFSNRCVKVLEDLVLVCSTLRRSWVEVSQSPESQSHWQKAAPGEKILEPRYPSDLVLTTPGRYGNKIVRSKLVVTSWIRASLFKRGPGTATSEDCYVRTKLIGGIQ